MFITRIKISGGEIGGGRGGLSPPTLKTGWAQPPLFSEDIYNNTTLKRTLNTSKNKDEQRKATTIVTYNLKSDK